MTDTVFRQKIEHTKEEDRPIQSSEQAKPIVSVEPPYLDYQKVNSRPYVADYFQLGEMWDDPVGGFPKEVSAIENYIQQKIVDGDMANSQSAVKEELKRILKINNLQKEERSILKIETLAANIQFLKKTDDIKHNMRRYGTR